MFEEFKATFDSSSISEILSVVQEATIKYLDMPDAWIAGGPIRDLILGRPLKDLDIVVPKAATRIAREVAETTDWTLVILHDSKEGADFTRDRGRVEEVARVVDPQGRHIDFSSFRLAGGTIQDDLILRDFSINAMAVKLDDMPLFMQRLETALESGADIGDLTDLIIDPTKGLADIRSAVVRMAYAQAFEDDPLRMIRALRFAAQLDFSLAKETEKAIRLCAELATKSAWERISVEMDLILDTERAAAAFSKAWELGLLQELIPELLQADGVEQPGFHHLDVLGHSLEALRSMDMLVRSPEIAFEQPEPFVQWLKENRGLIPALKWAALCHDLGKPAQRSVREDGRVTFYEHDKMGAELTRRMGRRLRWSKKQLAFTVKLVSMHMRPFHLLGEFNKGRLTKRAMRRLLNRIGNDYPALFLLAMADSMAGVGPLKPKDLDQRLAALFYRIDLFYRKHMEPLSRQPRLLDGREIMEICGIGPGPAVGRILEALEEARVDGRVKDREGAVTFVVEVAANITNSDSLDKLGLDGQQR